MTPKMLMKRAKQVEADNAQLQAEFRQAMEQYVARHNLAISKWSTLIWGDPTLGRRIREGKQMTPAKIAKIGERMHRFSTDAIIEQQMQRAE